MLYLQELTKKNSLSYLIVIPLEPGDFVATFPNMFQNDKFCRYTCLFDNTLVSSTFYRPPIIRPTFLPQGHQHAHAKIRRPEIKLFPASGFLEERISKTGSSMLVTCKLIIIFITYWAQINV